MEQVNIYDIWSSFIAYSVYQMWQWNKQQLPNDYRQLQFRCQTYDISLFFQIDMTCMINFRMIYIKHIYFNNMTLFSTVIQDNINRFRVLAGRLITGLVLRSVRYTPSFTLVGKWGNLSEWRIWQSRHKFLISFPNVSDHFQHWLNLYIMRSPLEWGMPDTSLQRRVTYEIYVVRYMGNTWH